MECMYKSYEEVPLVLCAEEIAQLLGISRSAAYGMLHTKGFPTIQIGKRMVVQKDRLVQWMNAQIKE